MLLFLLKFGFLKKLLLEKKTKRIFKKNNWYAYSLNPGNLCSRSLRRKFNESFDFGETICGIH